jgi:hypothetical protein
MTDDATMRVRPAHGVECCRCVGEPGSQRVGRCAKLASAFCIRAVTRRLPAHGEHHIACAE